MSLTHKQDNKPAASRLITARPAPASAPASTTRKRNASQSLTKGAVIRSPEEKQSDPDLARAYTLLELHREVKTSYAESPGQTGRSSLNELHEARTAVDRALRSLGANSLSLEQSTPGHHIDDISRQSEEQHDAGDDEMEDEDVSAWA